MSCGLRTVLQVGAHLRAHGSPRWCQTKGQPRQNGDAGGKDKDFPVEMAVERIGLPLRCHELGNCISPDVTEQKSGRSAEYGQKQAFGEHLAENPRAPRAKGET